MIIKQKLFKKLCIWININFTKESLCHNFQERRLSQLYLRRGVSPPTRVQPPRTCLRGWAGACCATRRAWWRMGSTCWRRAQTCRRRRWERWAACSRPCGWAPRVAGTVPYITIVHLPGHSLLTLGEFWQHEITVKNSPCGVIFNHILQIHEPRPSF